ncbi:MAG: hypothetical protein AB7S26_05655 [Sandaracinaceae bacterium]
MASSTSKRPLKLLGIGCGLLLFVSPCCCLSGSYVSRTVHDGGANGVAEAFLRHAGAGDHSSAYELTAPSYRAGHALDAFERELRGTGLVGVTTASCPEPREELVGGNPIDNFLPRDTHELSCSVTGIESPTVRVSVSYEDGAWAVAEVVRDNYEPASFW